MQGVLGSDRHPVEWKFQAGGGSKAKMPYVAEGKDIFWHYTVPSYYISFNRIRSIQAVVHEL